MKKLSVFSEELQVTSYKLQVTSYNHQIIKSSNHLIPSAFCLLLFTFCLLPNALFAQKAKPPKHNHNNKKPEIALIENKMVFTGVTFGPTVDWFVPTTSEFELEREKIKGGFIAGINVDVNLVSKRFIYFSTGILCRYLQGELAFDHQYTFSYLDISLVLPTVRTYQTMYLAIPTGIKFRTPPSKNCIFSGQLGFYHNFKVGGKQFDNFILPNIGSDYFTTTGKVKNVDASLFAETVYLGIGFEYEFAPKIRVFTNVNYSCQLGYFSNKAINNVSDKQFKSIVHSLNMVFGISF